MEKKYSICIRSAFVTKYNTFTNDWSGEMHEKAADHCHSFITQGSLTLENIAKELNSNFFGETVVTASDIFLGGSSSSVSVTEDSSGNIDLDGSFLVEYYFTVTTNETLDLEEMFGGATYA